MLQESRQFSLESFTRDSELSLRYNNFDLIFVEEEIMGLVEVDNDCLEN